MIYNETRAVKDLKEFFKTHEDAKTYCREKWMNLLARVEGGMETGSMDIVVEAVQDISSDLRKVGLK